MITNVRQPDGSGVPDVPLERYNPDGSPDWSHIETVPAEIHDGRKPPEERWTSEGPDWSHLTNNKKPLSNKALVLQSYILNFGALRGLELYEALTNQQILDIAEGILRD
jgi:hypothetical protein